MRGFVLFTMALAGAGGFVIGSLMFLTGDDALSAGWAVMIGVAVMSLPICADTGR
jgi:hypothetical protein